MHLNPAQLAVLKAAIAAETDPTFAQLRQAGATGAMADWYNLPASPAYTVWKSSVSRDDVTGDGFDWTQVDNLSAGQARIWDLLFDTASRKINPSRAGLRAGILECWKGTAAKVAVGVYILSQCKRLATRSEKLFATGLGTDAAPSTMSVEGMLSNSDIVEALGA